MKRLIICLLTAILCSCSSVAPNKNTQQFDIVIYGGTSAGVASAIQSAREGKSVVLIAPEKNLGAMSTSGLGLTDSGKTHVIGGISKEFYSRIWKEYQNPQAWNFQPRESFTAKGQGTKAINDQEKTMWIFEPKVALKVYNDWLAEYPNIKIYKNEFLDRENGVKKEANKIISITTLSGMTFKGKIFIDAGFEGDLLASAGCEYIVGRESNSQYNETGNGVNWGKHFNRHKFEEKVCPYKIEGDKSSGLLKYVSDEKPKPVGTADNKLQAYCFRMCLTSHQENRIEIEKPDNYDPQNYELLGRYMLKYKTYHPFTHSIMPNHKTDLNNVGAFSSDFIGQNYDYPQASYQEREKIVKAHKDYQLGLLYFLKTDQRTPFWVRKSISKLGLPKDEFIDTQNWPFNLYIREARRLIGEYVMTQTDCSSKTKTPKSIGMGSYTMDSHNASRFVTDEGYVQNEGDVQISVGKPYPISYGAVIPKAKDCENLFVTAAVSASHIAYGSIRMEPVFMILGQSVATASSIAIDDNVSVQNVDYEKLKNKLLKDGQVLQNN